MRTKSDETLRTKVLVDDYGTDGMERPQSIDTVEARRSKVASCPLHRDALDVGRLDTPLWSAVRTAGVRFADQNRVAVALSRRGGSDRRGPEAAGAVPTRVRRSPRRRPRLRRTHHPRRAPAGGAGGQNASARRPDTRGGSAPVAR